jgi:PKD repeat protein
MHRLSVLLYPLVFVGLFSLAYDAISISIQNTSRINTAPITVTISASPSNAKVGHPVSLVCTAVGGLPPYTFAWTFGDGSTGTGASVTHSYSAPGKFTVVCTVTDSLATIGTGQTTVTVT